TYGPSLVSVGDLNGDGRLDLVASFLGSGTVVLNIGSASRYFTAGQTYYVTTVYPNTPSPPALGDFNGAGKLDLAVTSTNNSTVSVLPGNGDGTFGAESLFAVGGNPAAVVVGDVNGDGKLDLVTANNGSAGVLLGNGDGTFAAPQTYALPG